MKPRLVLTLQILAAITLPLPCLSITWGSWLVAAAERVSPWAERGAIGVLALLGTAPLFVMVWLALLVRAERTRRARGLCVACAYPLRDVEGLRCPECGERFPPGVAPGRDIPVLPGNT